MPYLGWSGILDASQYRNACPQFDSSSSMIGSEDCLNLNVFTKNLIANPINEPQQLLPVMVYIHAESYENGDSSLYGSEKLMDQNIVLVTFNYRLGILGFLSTEDHHSNGNFGLYDQVLALKWVSLNSTQCYSSMKQKVDQSSQLGPREYHLLWRRFKASHIVWARCWSIEHHVSSDE